MEFTLPTNKTEMYNVLGEIFYYYRIRREQYEEFILPELTLERMTFTPLTDDELTVKATTMLASKHEREVIEYKNGLNERIEKLKNLKDLEETQREKQVESCIALYEETKEKVRKEAQRNGLLNSSIVINKLSEIEEQKNQAVLKINAESNQKQIEYEAEIVDLTTKIDNADEYFSKVFNQEITEKVITLKKEQDETEIEVFKYNNSIEEKCQRYKGTVATTNANLRIKYLQINSEFFSKDQLIEMGYYNDVIDCVCAFYNTMEPVAAYRDIVSETKLMIYLDDFYQDIVYMFEARLDL